MTIFTPRWREEKSAITIVTAIRAVKRMVSSVWVGRERRLYPDGAPPPSVPQSLTDSSSRSRIMKREPQVEWPSDSFPRLSR